MGDKGIFLKTSAPFSVMTTYRMSLISAGSISLDSTFRDNGGVKIHECIENHTYC